MESVIEEKKENNISICGVIMAGGTGSRLWPLSRAAYPKQFQRLHGQDTLLQSTLKRLDGIDMKSSITICNEEHRFFVAEQLREIDRLDNIILEPTGRSTAPAIALAAFLSDDDPILLVLPADHVIQDEGSFTKAVLEALPLAESGKLVTFGIVPNEPNTGYGYIKKGEAISSGYSVDLFIEKPTIEKAKEYISSGNYYWNSGMFLFQASRYLEELKKFRPEIYEFCKKAIDNKETDFDFLRVDKDNFELCPNESIDYAVMENTSEAVVVPMNASWNDIGSWSSLWDISEKDSNGNAKIGDVIVQNSRNSYIRTDERLVAAVGVEDLVIISSKDALLVAHKDASQEAGNIAKELKSNKRSEWENHREVYRPWGKYDSIDIGDLHQAKRITVKPGAKLSVQRHNLRSEHWVVVSGTAKVTNGNKTFLLSENEYTYIPVGTIHALENPGGVDLEIIEVQSGSYLGEDDIERLSDIYGRNSNS